MVVKEEFMMRPATMDDLGPVVRLLNDVLEYQVGARTFTVENVRSDWDSPDFKLENSIRLIVNTEGDLVGVASIWDTDAVPVNIWLGLDIHPDYRETAVGERLLRWAEQRARQAISRVPDHARVVLHSGAHVKETATKTS